MGVLTLDILDGQIQAIRGVSNPDKLQHLGPLADAWEIRREVNQARRHPADGDAFHRLSPHQHGEGS
jgi:hypothetical protein